MHGRDEATKQGIDTNGEEYDVLIVGAGFAGLYALHSLRGLGLRCRVVEAGSDVGGTWYWNRYPGARCDAQSLIYCYMFDQALHGKWQWTERYAAQPEIHAYLRFVAEELDLRREIEFDTRVESARYCSETHRWQTVAGDRQYSTRWVVMATGPLSIARLPDIPGIKEFKGAAYHTAAWPEEPVNFAGKRVAVIGTGSSGVQVIPEIARQAEALTVFQRTACFVLPSQNTAMKEQEQADFQARFDTFRSALRAGQVRGTGDVLLTDRLDAQPQAAAELTEDERECRLEQRWQIGGVQIAAAFSDTLTDDFANEAVADFCRRMIAKTVEDEATAKALTPQGFPFGAKRICVGTGYYETFNQDHVALVDVGSDPIVSIRPTGIETQNGLHEVDVVVYATGFDAVTGALEAIDLKGTSGRSLAEVWQDGAKAYLGLAINEFPNLFTLVGPGSPSALSTVTVSIEQHVEWLTDLLCYCIENGVVEVEARKAAQEDWTREVADVAAGTVFTKAKSWYTGDNVPGKPRVFLAYAGGVGPYRARCDAEADAGYQGFHFRRP